MAIDIDSSNTTVKNYYRPVTQRFDGSFHKFGTEIKKLLTKYPIQNNIWSVIGEEFITSYTLAKSDDQFLDPWARPFQDDMIKKMITVELPEKHVKLPVTVEGVLYMCNVYVRALNSVEVDCNECIGRNFCVECNKRGKKIVVFPMMN
jgi:hypothetical protein